MKALLRHLVVLGILLAGPQVLFYTGFASNALVMAANGGQMPVLVPGGCTDSDVDRWHGEVQREGMQVHTCMTPETHLKVLGDWIVLRGRGIMSLGDALLWASELSSTPLYWMSWMYIL